MRTSLWIRIGLGYLALVSLQIGVWALLAPQSFYDNFPGLGRAWVSVDGPYNEHLLRDVGALNLALASLIIYAAITLSRQLIVASSVASLIWGLAHFVYHVFNTDELDGSDIVASLGGLVVFAAIPIGLLVAAKNLDARSA